MKLNKARKYYYNWLNKKTGCSVAPQVNIDAAQVNKDAAQVNILLLQVNNDAPQVNIDAQQVDTDRKDLPEHFLQTVFSSSQLYRHFVNGNRWQNR